MPDPSLIGQELDQFPLPVEWSKVREFAVALLDDDPIYQDERIARDAGFTGISGAPDVRGSVVPFPGRAGAIRAARPGPAAVLHGESTWEYLGPVNVGDQLIGHRRIEDITTRPGKRGGEMTLVTLVVDFVNQHGDMVLRERYVVIETGGLTVSTTTNKHADGTGRTERGRLSAQRRNRPHHSHGHRPLRRCRR